MAHPKKFVDENGKTWDTRQFDDGASWSKAKKSSNRQNVKPKESGIPNLLGRV